MELFGKSEIAVLREQLDEAQGITDDMVEVAARATWEQAEREQAARYGRAPRLSPEAWLTAPLGEREVYLRRARAALEAVSSAMAVQTTREVLARPAEADEMVEYWHEIALAAPQAAGAVAAVHLCTTCAQSMCRRRRDIEDACEDPLFPAKAVIVECKAYVSKKDVQEVTEDAERA